MVGKDSSSSSSEPLFSRNRGLRIMKKVIMGLIVIILIGYFFIWIMMPTSSYRKQWRPKISSATDSSYFGFQGSRLLLNTAPLILIAVLGCVYLHLGKNLDSINTDRRKIFGEKWRKPLIIKGLGIISWIELSFFVMLIALHVWTFAIYLNYFFDKASQIAEANGEKVVEVKLERVALVLGIAGNISLTLLFFPVTRGTSVLAVFGLTSEGSIKYHIWLGHLAMIFFSVHGFLYIIYWILTHQLSEMLEWSKTGISNLAGEISLLCGLVLWITTYPTIRRKMFELFFYSHHLYILFIIFFVFHLGSPFALYMLPGFYLFLLDRYLRFLQSRYKVPLISARILPCQTLELNFSKSPGLSYNPTSIMFINIPSISKLQWHPFTINSSSNLETGTLSVIIKREGKWTDKLCQMIADSAPSINHLNVSVEGPYGPHSTHFLRHEKLVMVSGGSGISPFISIIREMIFINTKLKQKTPEIILISAFKNSSDLTMLDLILPYPNTPNSVALDLDLQIQAYVTRQKCPSVPDPNPSPNSIRTVWFNPSQNEVPISSTLGQNNWLWLGAIILFSFSIFVLLMGIITRFYIYPIDHNTNKIFSQPIRSLLTMLIVCISIVSTASLAFIWNKRKQSNSPKVLEGPKEDSPLGNGETELESFPQEHSIAKSIKVHYGERPDLQRLISECEGESSTGVLVCGPKKMRHEVARICSSCSKQNLHFESISFSW